MSKRKRKAAKTQKSAAPKTNEKIVSFFRDHSLGIVLFALLSAAGGALVWHGRDCLTEQKTQMATARKAWTNVRTTYQKHSDDLSAFFIRFELYKMEKGNPGDEVSDNHHFAAMYELAQAMNADCNASKAALYEFDREMRALARRFKFNFVDSNDLPTQCESEAKFAELLRSVPIDGREYFESDNFAGVVENLRTNQFEVSEDEREADLHFESLMGKLESKNIMARLWLCFW